MFESVNCTAAPNDTTTDAGVAGTGVLLSFIITAALSLLLSAVIILHESRGKSEAVIPRKLLLSFSDQQIITGIGIQSVALAKMTSMVPYHFFIVWMLSVLSTATHVATLLALVRDFRRDWVLRWLRQVLMAANLLVSCVSGVFVLLAQMKNLPATLPVACIWKLDADGPPPGNSALSLAGTIGVIAGNCIFFALGVWYLHVKRQGWLKAVQIAGLVVLVAIGVGVTVRVLLLSQAFGSPSVNLRDGGERDWSFGQLLPLLLLLLPVLSAVEITRGEMLVPPPLAADDRPQSLDWNGEEIKDNVQLRHSFQPNPFWGRNDH